MTQASVRYRYSRFATLVDGKERVGAKGQRLETHITTLGAEYFLGDGWLLSATLPVGALRHQTGDGSPPGRVMGLGDLRVGGGYDLAALWGMGGGKPSLVARLDLVLPTGEVGTTGGGDVPPTLAGLGSGAYGVAPSLAASWAPAAGLALGLNVAYSEPLHAARTGVRFGRTVNGGGSVAWIVSSDFWLHGGVNGSVEARAHEDGKGVILQSGGWKLAAEVGLGARLHDDLMLDLGARVPFYRSVHGTQLSETFTVSLGFVALWGDDDGDDDDGDHEHGAGCGHDHGTAPPGDDEAIATGGASFDLAAALVPGKVTVIDFWAEWCPTCKQIGRDLARLARAHPDDLAVRRAEVVDFEHPIARDHLQDVDGLPVVWIFGPDGRRLRTLEGVGSSEVVRAVKDALR